MAVARMTNVTSCTVVFIAKLIHGALIGDKASHVKAGTGHEGSRRLRLPGFQKPAHEGGKISHPCAPAAFNPLPSKYC
jgi:hypothetical protein